MINQTACFVLILIILSAGITCRAEDYVIDEQFENLESWVPVTFPKIKKHSTYEIEQSGNRALLVAKSMASASGIRHTTEFNVYNCPVIRWKWKVDNVFAKGNALEKSGDDYPLQVYVMFKYDPDRASFGERLKYGLAKTLYGAYPPKSSLNYIWANKFHENRILPSPYTDRAQLVMLRAGNGQAGKWVEEQVNIIEDYQQAFGTTPPETASIAIMNDSDNTGEAATSYMDYIQVLRSE